MTKKLLANFRWWLLLMVVALGLLLYGQKQQVYYNLALAESLPAGAAQRIISLTPAYTEIIFALDCGDRLVADTDYCDYPAAARDKQHIGGFYNPDIEKIVMLEPDLVLADAAFQYQQIAKLKSAGINVQSFTTRSLGDIITSIKDIAALTGSQTAADKLLAAVDLKASAPSGYKIFVQLQSQPLISCGNQSYINDIITLAGAKNAAGAKNRAYTLCDVEDLYSWQPDIYVISSPAPADGLEFCRQAAAQDISAIAEKKIYWLDENIVGRPGPRVFNALQDLRKIVEGERKAIDSN